MVLTVAPPMIGVTGKQWRPRGTHSEDLLTGVRVQPLIRHLLQHRGLTTAGAATAFLEGRDPGHDVSLLPDIEPAVARLRAAVTSGERISVYGDFDVDGITACSIVVEALRGLGGNAVPYIPNRHDEGYGVNPEAVLKLADEGATLIVTVDCGTGSVDDIALARSLGADVIVIDHHTVPPSLPAAVALINPKRPDSEYPERELSSGGLVFRVMQALYDAMARPFDEGRYLDLVALSTVCDMVPLRGENRFLVRRGLEALAKTQRPGLRSLLEVSGCDPSSVDADTIGFALGPRLNAAGRLSDGNIALGLLMECDEGRARETALHLGELNRERQGLTRAAVDLARGLVAGDGPPLIFVGHEEFEQGIVGLVAARLAEDFHRPAIVYQRGESVSRASCRSIPGFDITAALRECGNLMVKFGGHAAAAGFTAENGRLAELAGRLQQIAERDMGAASPVPTLDVDATIPLGHVNGNFVLELRRLEPFGQANPRPLFLSRGLEVTGVRQMGDDGQHLRLNLRDGQATWGSVAFGMGEHAPAIGDRLNVVYTFSADRGYQRTMELHIEDFAHDV